MGKKRNGKIIVCKACSCEFYVPKYRAETAVFCSYRCSKYLQFDKSKHKCKQCENEFTSSPSRKGKRVFCSKDCLVTFFHLRKEDQKKHRREKIAKLRAEGKVPKNGAGLRKYVFASKINECMVCGYKEYKSCLDVHHIDSDPNNNKLDNLAILCAMCHRMVHRKIIEL